jgi:AcrR family transcriptional regulator
MKGQAARNQQRARREASRAKVRQAAVGVFQEFGFEGSTMKMLAERAGLSVGMTHQLYGGKADPLLDMISGHNTARWEALCALAQRAAGFDGLVHLLALSHGFDLRIPALTGIVVAQSWLWSSEHETRNRGDVAGFRKIIGQVLSRGHPNAPPPRRDRGGVAGGVRHPRARPARRDPRPGHAGSRRG